MLFIRKGFLLTKFRNNVLSTVIALSLLGLAKPAFAQSKIQVEIKAAAKQITGYLGVYAEILETGETASFNGNKHFPMQSVYKFPIAIAVLHAVDEGKLKIDQKVKITKEDYIPSNGHSPIREKFPNGTDITIRDLIRYSVSESDGSASDALLKSLGGIQVANNYIHQLGIKDISIAITEKVQVANDRIQYQNWSTPKAMTDLLKIFYSQKKLSTESMSILLTDMVESTPGQHRLKGLLPKGTVVAHKTGTSGTTNDKLTRATNDAGIITLPNGNHLAITVFLSDSYSSEPLRELTIAKVAKAAYEFLGSS